MQSIIVDLNFRIYLEIIIILRDGSHRCARLCNIYIHDGGAFMTKIYPVIMCGGAGTRLWPLSIKSKPKQFHSIVTDKSMLQETILRLMDVDGVSVAPPSFVCALDHEGIIREQCEDLGIVPLAFILEPCAKNTAAVAAAIALHMGEIDPTGLVLLLPADHHVENPGDFWAAVANGVPSAIKGYLTTFGILPTRAETGYGYIQAGDVIGEQCVNVAAFVEKPNKDTAEAYLRSGNYFWNGGIFLFQSSIMIEQFEQHANDILNDVKAAFKSAKYDNGSVYLDSLAFSKCRSESIDYAIMEKAQKVAMVCPVDMGWTDIGSWEAVRDYVLKNPVNSDTISNTYSLDCENSLIRSDGPFVAAIGLKNIIVVATKTSVLITDSEHTQDVKKVVEMLRESQQVEKL